MQFVVQVRALAQHRRRTTIDGLLVDANEIALKLRAVLVLDQVLLVLTEENVLLLVGVLAIGEKTLQEVVFTLQLLVVRADGQILEFDLITDQSLVARAVRAARA